MDRAGQGAGVGVGRIPTTVELSAALFALALAALGCAAAQASHSVPEAAPQTPPAPVSATLEVVPSIEGRIAATKGWSYLVEKAIERGVPRAVAEAAFADPRMPSFDGLLFRVDPREPRSMYREVLRERSVADARECRAEHAEAFSAAERAYGVSADVVAAILHVETRCGRNTGASGVLHGLARLAMANDPGNVDEVIRRSAVTDGVLDEALADRVRARAQRLEEMFLPEVVATFEVAGAEGADPLSYTGSPSGAFGVPQFLPTSYQRYGADGNGDGRVDLYDVDDAAASAARYLAAFGWSEALGRSERRQVIWHYNHSDAYIDAVLDLAGELAPPATQSASAPAAEPVVESADASN
jgi:membrane-bound lytic murein transglycosylase B